MKKNILLITGSPRKGGNSDKMASAFLKGATEAGHTVNRFDAAFHKVAGCKACDTCWSKGTPCSFADDFNDVFAPLLEQADTIVFCMPLYYYGFPAQIKAPLDKMYAYVVPQAERKLTLSESAFMICGGDDAEESYGGAVETYRLVAKYCGWKDRGILLATGVLAKEDIDGTDYLKQAQALGAQM